VKISSVNVYTVDPAANDYGGTPNPRAPLGYCPPETEPEPVLRMPGPMSAFPEFHNRSAGWKGYSSLGWGYAPFVVEIETDTGASGFAVNHGGGELACEVVDGFFRPLIEGKNPFDTTLIWEQMHRAQLLWDQGGVASMAMSAVDLALWDLKGKLLERPVYDLIGGRTKDAMPVYVTTFEPVMEHMTGKGFCGVKIQVTHGPQDPEGVARVEALTERARDLFGSLPLRLECFLGWDEPFTIAVAERVRRFDVEWIEDPLLPDVSIRRYRELREAIRPIQLAIGNLMWGEQRFHDLIEQGGADVIQPELQWAGGMTSALRIAAMCRGRGVKMIPHWSGVYSYHFTQALFEAPYAEYVAHLGDRTEVIPKGGAIIGEPAPVDGHLVLSDAPGFGIELNRDAIRPYSRDAG
jgi:L-alanine-DL-glutamate epimerase-like enolase superfamily enzyme